jgi:hypothetical protein
VTIWYSRKPILPGAGKKNGVYHVFSADQIHEIRELRVWLAEHGPGLHYSENCRKGLAAIGRRSGRPVVIVHSSLVDRVETELQAIEVPDGYLQVIITRLRREYVRLDPLVDLDDDPKVVKYFREKLSAQRRELVLGRITRDGGREIPDVIRDPDELDDTTDADDPEYVSAVKRRITQLKILNSQIENLDLGHRSRLKLTEEPAEKDLNSYIPRKKQEVIPDLEPVADKPWLKRAAERGWE